MVKGRGYNGVKLIFLWAIFRVPSSWGATNSSGGISHIDISYRGLYLGKSKIYQMVGVMAKEKSLWETISCAMNGLWHAQRHEDKHSVGIPDVSFGMNGFNGWIELKHINRWPAKGKIVKIPHLTSQQVNWLYDRNKKGGNCWLLLRVDNEYLFFKGDSVLDIGYIKESDVRKLAYMIFIPYNAKHLRFLIYKTLTGQY